MPVQSAGCPRHTGGGGSARCLSRSREIGDGFLGCHFYRGMPDSFCERHARPTRGGHTMIDRDKQTVESARHVASVIECIDKWLDQAEQGKLKPVEFYELVAELFSKH